MQRMSPYRGERIHCRISRDTCMGMTLAHERCGMGVVHVDPLDRTAVKPHGQPPDISSTLSLVVPALSFTVESWAEVLQHACKGNIEWRVCRHLVENIYSREVFEEYRRRCAKAKGETWSAGVIPEAFLGKVSGESKRDSALQPPYILSHLPVAELLGLVPCTSKADAYSVVALCHLNTCMTPACC